MNNHHDEHFRWLSAKIANQLIIKYMKSELHCVEVVDGHHRILRSRTEEALIGLASPLKIITD